ncbi:MAG: response regulator [Syntrophobacteraceae bacterium]
MKNSSYPGGGFPTVLLVEDDPEDREFILEDLAPIIGRKGLEVAGRLDEAIAMAVSRPFDLIMLDLGLPDSSGLNTFINFHAKAPEIPFVVITGRDDDQTAMQALKAGAQDYLVKGRITKELLSRSIRYSIERHRLLLKLETERIRGDREREQNALELIAAPAETSVTSCMYGRAPLRERAPGIFHEMVDRYTLLLDSAMERRVLKNQVPPGNELRRLAEEMGQLCAGPKEVLEVHLEALRKRCEAQTPPKVKAMTEEGRFMMIELMGYLLSFYRGYYSSYVRTVKSRQYGSDEEEGL